MEKNKEKNDFTESFKQMSLSKESNVLSFMLFAFLILVQPYDMSDLQLIYRLVYSFFYALSFWVAYYITTTIFGNTKRGLIKNIDPKKYAIFIFFLVEITFFLVVGVDVVLKVILPSEDNFFSKISIDFAYLKISFARVAMLIIFYQFLVMLLKYFFVDSLNKERNAGFNLKNLSREGASKNSKLTIVGLNKNEVVDFNSKDFLYAKSEGHYIKIYYLADKTNSLNPVVRSIIIRNSMRNLGEGVLSDIITIDRVHKSYFVNYEHVKSLKTINHKGGILTLSLLDIKIPVGKTNINRVLSYVTLNAPSVTIYKV